MTEPIVTREEDRTVVQPAGDMVAAYVPELRLLLRDMVNGGARDLVLDLSKTEMVDSTGIGLVIGTYNSLNRVGGRLTVIHASRDVLQLFQTMRMHQRFPISGD